MVENKSSHVSIKGGWTCSSDETSVMDEEPGSPVVLIQQKTAVYKEEFYE